MAESRFDQWVERNAALWPELTGRSATSSAAGKPPPVVAAALVALVAAGGLTVPSLIADGPDLIAAPAPDNVTVLVSDPTAFAMEALLLGEVTVVQNCLGVNDQVVVWPPDTLVDSTNPLTITVPNLGSYRLGDQIKLGGGSVSRPDPDSSIPWTIGTLEIPKACGDFVFLAAPAR